MKEKRKTETEMEGLHEERFSGSGRGMENEGAGYRGVENEGEGYRGVEMIGGVSSETGLVMKKAKQKSTTGISASLTTDYRDRGKQQHKIVFTVLCV